MDSVQGEQAEQQKMTEESLDELRKRKKREWYKNYREENPEKSAEYVRNYAKEYYHKNRDRIREKRRLRRLEQKNKEN